MFNLGFKKEKKSAGELISEAGVMWTRSTDQQVTSAACSQHVSLHERSQGVERFILDAGDLSLACALIHSAETPGRGTESCLGGFPGLPTPLLSSFFPLLVSVCIRCDNSNHKRSSSLQGSYNWIWLAVTTNRAKYRLSGMLLGLFSSSQNLDQSEIRLRGTCFVSDAHCILDTWWQSWHRLAR